MQFRLISAPCESVVLPGDLVSATVPMTGTDWGREVVLVVDMGEQRTAGYSVKVTRVQVTPAGDVELELQVGRPGPGAFVAQVITHPYGVCRVPGSALPAGEVTVIARSGTGQEIARQVVPR